MINVRSTQDIRILDDRYAVVIDVTDTCRVVSLVRTPYRELQPRKNVNFISYVFNKSGYGGSDGREVFDQRDLKRLSRNQGVEPTKSEIEAMQRDGAISVTENCQTMANTVKQLLVSDDQPATVDGARLDTKTGGWIVGRIVDGKIVFESDLTIYPNYELAKAVLHYQAGRFPGQKMVMFKAAESAVTSTLKVETFA